MKEPSLQVTQVSGPRGALDCRDGRVAFFGGSFDPPHLGHLAVARAAQQALRLDKVLFAPVGAQPLKPEGSTAPFAHRLNMTELAIAGEPGFEISLADAPSASKQPNYTLETLRGVRAQMSATGSLFCLMGADSFASLSRWRGAADIPFAASLVVASRPGQNLDDLACCLPDGLTFAPRRSAVIEPPLVHENVDRPDASHRAGTGMFIELREYVIRNRAGEEAPFYVLPDLDIEISASDIRSQIRSASQESAASESLPAAVLSYIRSHGLYR